MNPTPSTAHESTAHVDAALLGIKPPLPGRRPRTAHSPNNAEVQVPPLIAGAVTAAFATALADGLDNDLLTHYYLPEQKVRINIDRVLDRLLADFTRQLWDELWQFYSGSNPESATQVQRLFDGPICQLVLILNGPEAPRCVLDKLGPGISRRPITWSSTARGIDLQLAIQLLCSYWDREFPARSPKGSPEEISRSLHNYITTGDSAKDLITRIREVLVSPHYVQMHLMESAVWDILMKRRRPPVDGFHIIQFKFECQLFGPLEGIGDPQLVSMGSLPAITGTANDCIYTTVAEYTSKQWPLCGSLMLGCIEEAVQQASASCRQGHGFSGMSLWDGSDEKGIECPSLRLLHLEVEDGSIRLSVSAWTHTMIEILQQMAWTCATLSASPFPGSISECTVEVSDWTYLDDSIYVDCSLSHRPVPEGDGAGWLKQLQGAAIASGFPINRHRPRPS